MLYNYNYFSMYYYIALLIVMKHGLKYIHNADSRFQIHALMLLNFFAPGCTLSSWQPRVLCSWILSLRRYKCAIHSGNRLREYLYIINPTL